MIDLEKYTAGGKVKNLSGKDRGLKAREEFDLDRIDSEGGPVEVRIPNSVYAVSTSFFCGMFGESYSNLGGPDKLREIYKFHVPDGLEPQIQQGLERCASQFKPLMQSGR